MSPGGTTLRHTRYRSLRDTSVRLAPRGARCMTFILSKWLYLHGFRTTHHEAGELGLTSRSLGRNPGLPTTGCGGRLAAITTACAPWGVFGDIAGDNPSNGVGHRWMSRREGTSLSSRGRGARCAREPISTSADSLERIETSTQTPADGRGPVRGGREWHSKSSRRMVRR